GAPPIPPPLPHPAQDESAHGPFPLFGCWADRPWAAPPGWFAEAEIDLVGLHVKNRLVAPVNVGGFFTDNVHVPGAELGSAASPRFALGYRFPNNGGEISFAYRFLVADGRSAVPAFDAVGDGCLHSHLDLHTFDLDYASPFGAITPCWDFKWRIGLRL